MSSQKKITDSPWLWFALFSAVGLTALLVTGGKFGNRQAQIERKGQVRIAYGEGMTVSEDGTGRKTAENAPNYSRPGMTKIRLAPLATTIGLVLVVSIIMLAREQLLENNVLVNHGGTVITEQKRKLD